jgi:hypothetical protein
MRCSSKGPEPEVVDLGMVEGRLLAFVAIERSDAFTIHDVTDPAKIRLLDLVVLNPAIVGACGSAQLEPEGIVFIESRRLVVVSNPRNGTVSLAEVRVQ